uniref:hypothetical protein n=1 Tax=Herbidospora sakaeratensis TaxID=564415 RepID=UPI000AA48376|nr:hypothetical protein [Herbidospora sakaeratensis]
MKLGRFARAAATLVLVGGVTLVTPGPAHAAPTCNKGWSSDLRTAWIDCDNGLTTGMFRLKAQFCVQSGCAWRYGPNKYYDGGGRSSKTDPSAYVNTSSITYEDMGPGSLAPR